MVIERGYRSYEEFEREELRKTDRMEVRVDELLCEFDQEHKAAKRASRQGLFDSYEEQAEENEYYDE